MIEIYMTDIIKIIEVTHDKFGVVTEQESENVPARIEDTNSLIRNIQGQEVMPNMLIMFEYENEIKPTYKVKIKKKNGIEYDQPDKKWQIMKYEKTGMFKRSHVEAFI